MASRGRGARGWLEARWREWHVPRLRGPQTENCPERGMWVLSQGASAGRGLGWAVTSLLVTVSDTQGAPAGGRHASVS